ncbi:4-(cytidine 5'-diphospho)-2-C-methyl-D-erythritol kinase [Rhodocyclaceae bacterium SMB388]
MDAIPVSRLDACPAPAKLNLFLHVVGQRADGYHLLQTAFRLLDWHDLLSFELRPNGRISRATDLPGVPEQQDITVRAARLLQQESGTRLGVSISIDKRLPMGGGLGGGSSDAATTLIALNRLWRTGLSRTDLAHLGLRLGADVPFFVFGRDAFAEGIGERLTPLPLAPARYVVVWPDCHVPTQAIFASKELTRNTEPITISDFASRATRNDLQAVACKLYPQVAAVVEWLGQYAPARMTGSGACVFAEVDDETSARRIVESCPAQWQAWGVRSIAQHPLHHWLD